MTFQTHASMAEFTFVMIRTPVIAKVMRSVSSSIITCSESRTATDGSEAPCP